MKQNLLFLILLLLPLAYAQSLDDSLAHLDEIKDEYNQNIDDVPDFLRKLIGTERIQTHITRDNGTEVIISAVTEDGLIEELREGEVEEPTLIAHTSESTVNEISAAEDPLQRLQQALSDGEITYEATSITKKVKWGLSSVVMKVAGWLQKFFK